MPAGASRKTKRERIAKKQTRPLPPIRLESALGSHPCVALSSAPSRAEDTGAGAFRQPLRPRHNCKVKSFWSIRPRGKSAKNWSRSLPATAGPCGSRLNLEWIAPGCTAVCFWIAPRRLIAALEGRPGFSLLPPSRLNPNRCLAGLHFRDSAPGIPVRDRQ
jgi:hypothetical protein